MSLNQVAIILLSGLGVVHGLVLAIFLWTYPKGSVQSNRILSVLLMVLSLRIGKSVILEFVPETSLTLIFIGLAALLTIGPLFYLYTESVLKPKFRFQLKQLVHFIPLVPALVLAFYMDQGMVDNTSVQVFRALFAFYYGHYLVYLVAAFRLKKTGKITPQNRDGLIWLNILFIALMVIWISYVLNLFEDQVPYILGPIIYSFAAYSITIIALRKGYPDNLQVIKYQTTPAEAEEIDEIFDHVQRLVAEHEEYKKPDVTLQTLSKKLKVSPQKLSMSINTRFGSNFNDFINHYRVRESRRLLLDPEYGHHTIAAIAYASGFSSLSSFNSAFKKITGKTPSVYQKTINK